MSKSNIILGIVATVLVGTSIVLGGMLVTRPQPKEAGVPTQSLGMVVTPPTPVPLSHTSLAQQLPPTPSVFTPTQMTPDLTTGWNMYRNEQYGFELQYPSAYGFKEMSVKDVEYTGHPELVLFFGKLGDDVDHSPIALNVYNTPLLFVAEAFSDVLEKAEKITVNGHVGFRISPNQAGGEDVYVQKDDKVILLLICSPSELCPETERRIFDRIVKTIKFKR